MNFLLVDTWPWVIKINECGPGCIFLNSFIDHYTCYIQQIKQPERNEIYVHSDKVKRAGANGTLGPMRGTSHDTNNN